MAALSTIVEVRTLGNLPAVDKIADSIIQPHLDSAARELVKWVGDYSTATGDKLAACVEAEGCICMAKLLPVINTMFTDGIITLQKEIGEIDLMFHRPEDLQLVIDWWWDRAKSAVSAYTSSGGSINPIGWYAI